VAHFEYRRGFHSLEKIDSYGSSVGRFSRLIGGLGEAKSTMYLVSGRRSDVRDGASVINQGGKEMKTTRLALLIVVGAVVLTSGQVLAEQDARHLLERDIPIPATVSPATQAVIGRPLSPIWNEHPKSAEEWKVLIARVADGVVATLPDLRQRLGVKVEPTVIGGVKAYVVTPESIPETNRNRLLVHVHGGGYVFGPGEAGTREAILMAGYSGIKVISVDYRMPPDFPYPAALDDAMAV